jgi:copper chaperone CopZ
MQRLFLKILPILLLILSLTAHAQIRSVVLGVNGLHCSACSYGTEQSLRKLDFIKDITMDLNKHEATITFIPGKDIDLKAMAQKVVEAGFTVRDMFLVIDFNHYTPADKAIYAVQNIDLHFVTPVNKTLDTDVRLQIIGTDYMSKAAFKQWKSKLPEGGSDKFAPAQNRKAYFVTL